VCARGEWHRNVPDVPSDATAACWELSTFGFWRKLCQHRGRSCRNRHRRTTDCDDACGAC
jgi:hypothetical protein